MKIPEFIHEVYEKSSCLHPLSEIETALDKMASEIHDQLAESNPIFLCVMIGGLIPMGHLLTRLDFPLEVDYVHATRYRGETQGKELQWKVEPRTDLAGRNVVIVDDILDGGVTLAGILDYVKQAGAASAYTAVLVDKHHVRLDGGVDQADFTGIQITEPQFASRYVFGFGLDYKEYLRNAPGIFVVAREHE